MAQYTLQDHINNAQEKLGVQITVANAREESDGWLIEVDGGWLRDNRLVRSYDNGAVELQ